MPQRDLLLPWRSVLDNAAIPLELRGVPRNRAREEAASWFPRFGLQGFERSYPARLSGGMRQRAALLRTFLTGRDILLLDEPFGALDALTRADMQEWLLDIWTGLAKTIVLVTHDVDEAIYLADRVCVMSPRPGTIEREIDIPLPRPRNHDAIVTSAAFAELKRTILNALRGDARTGGNP
jgi:ABC-type nitrate/sulfonate/bicarbonate transport system ATPase subunit